jgi:hypothetical protein
MVTMVISDEPLHVSPTPLEGTAIVQHNCELFPTSMHCRQPSLKCHATMWRDCNARIDIAAAGLGTQCCLATAAATRGPCCRIAAAATQCCALTHLLADSAW